MKLYFARHGITDANVDSPVDPISGEVDEPLNVLGIQQANELAEKLKDVSFDAIIASPLKRAFQTAEVVAAQHNLPVIINKEMRERDTAGHLALETWVDLFDFDKNIQPEKGENIQDFFARINNALEKLKREYKDKTVLVVAHGGVHTVLYAEVNKIPKVGNVRVMHLHNGDYRIYELGE